MVSMVIQFMNSTKYAVRFYTVRIEDGQHSLEMTREIQVHRLLNAAILLAMVASETPSEANPRIAKFFIKERGKYREIQPSDWAAEVHDKAKIGELGFP
jgi:hypothetical protein